MKKIFKTEIGQIIGMALSILLIIFIYWCGNAGTFKQEELDVNKLNNSNIFVDENYVNSCSNFTGIVSEFKYFDSCLHYVRLTPINYEEMDKEIWIDANLSKKDLRSLHIGDTITVHGRIRYTNASSPSNDTYIMINIGDYNTFIPFFFNAKLISVEEK